MHQGDFFHQALIYLAAAVISVPIAKRLGLGSVLGYLIAGIVIGPFGLHLLGEEGQDVMHFSEFGVVMMLFLIGLELKPSLLWKMRIPILGLGGAQVGITAVVIAGLGLAFGITFKSSLAIGLTLALSSTAIVLQTLNEKNLSRTTGGKNVFSVLLFQDIAIIPILAFMPLLASSEIVSPPDLHAYEGTTWTAGFSVLGKTLAVLGVITAIVLAGRFLISPIFRILAKTGLREIFTAAALLLVIGIAVLMINVGLSPALGTFLAGVILAQSEYRHELETDIEPFKGLLLGLFFIAVGASIDFHLIGDKPLLISQLVIGLIVLKFLVLFIIGKIYKMGLDNKFLFAFSLAQGGEFAFVLFSFAVGNQVVESETANILIAVVALTMALTPLIMLINEKLIQPRFGTKEIDSRPADSIEEENPIIIAGFGRMGSVIGRFLQASGIQATYLDIDPDNVDFLRKLGLKVYYGDASRYDLLKAAGAEKAKILIIAVNEGDKIIQIAETAKKHFPHLEILSRSSGWRNSYDLYDLGINNIYKETFGTAMRMAREAASKLGLRKYQTGRMAKKFMKHDEEALEEFARIRRENKSYIQDVKLHFENLEKLMLEEQRDAQKDKDLGWDPSTLIEEYNQRNA
jgi:monovalent cation:proton antiporter-2 (CPA2) family protein